MVLPTTPANLNTPQYTSTVSLLLGQVADALDRKGEAQAHKSPCGVAELLRAGIKGPKQARRVDPAVRERLSTKRTLLSSAWHLGSGRLATSPFGYISADVDGYVTDATPTATVATKMRGMTEDAGQAGVTSAFVKEEMCRRYILAVQRAFQDAITIEVVFDASSVSNRNTEVFVVWSPDRNLAAFLPPPVSQSRRLRGLAARLVTPHSARP